MIVIFSFCYFEHSVVLGHVLSKEIDMYFFFFGACHLLPYTCLLVRVIFFFHKYHCYIVVVVKGCGGLPLLSRVVGGLGVKMKR